MTCDLRQLLGSAMGEITRDRKRAEKEERDMSKIEWTGATWNPIVGCSLASPGCTNCYAMSMAHRLGHNPATPHYAGTTRRVNGNTVWTGKLAMAPDHVLTAPLRRMKPTTYFVNSMGDLFHEDVPDDWIDRVFAVMALCPQHKFQVLTKRSARMREYLTDDNTFDRVVGTMFELRDEHALPTVKEQMERHGLPWVQIRSRDDWWPLRNVWLGVSVEDQRRADDRIPDLLATPAAIRFISAEPLLGPLNLIVSCDDGSYRDTLNGRWWRPGNGDVRTGRSAQGLAALDWVITGGESGPGARPMHPDWARSLRDQCVAADVPFFFKQWGTWLPEDHVEAADPPDGIFNRSRTTISAAMRFYQVGKHPAGRLLDGREWNEVPTP